MSHTTVVTCGGAVQMCHNCSPGVKNFMKNFRKLYPFPLVDPHWFFQCWTEGRRSTAVAEDFRPTATATATVAEV